MASSKKVQDIEQKLERTERQLVVLQKVSRLMTRKMSLPDVLKAIVNLLVEATGGDACLIYLIDRDELVLCATSLPHPAQIGRIRLRMGEGLTGWVAKERRMVAISREAYKDSRFRLFTDLPEDTFEAFLSVPVIVRDEVVGVINVQHRQSHPHTGSEIEMLATVGEQVGCVIVLARLGHEIEYTSSHVEFLLSLSPPQPGKGSS
ncbi:MAG: GAF sensor protein [Acidobacteria bacterium RIFCSPLOWO2_12_FULL_60_22]|nr:MAG: GAF sensor protein [Acidobacteria bacterium RIFCSPLOWO2_12_FULL_60_22]